VAGLYGAYAVMVALREARACWALIGSAITSSTTRGCAPKTMIAHKKHPLGGEPHRSLRLSTGQRLRRPAAS